MAAYAIAASPDGVWSAGAPATGASALLAPLASVKQELGFGSNRHRLALTGQQKAAEDSEAPVDSKLAWAFAAVCLVAAMAQRRFVER